MRSRAIVTLAVFAAALVCGAWLLTRGFSRQPTPNAGARLFAEVFAHVQNDYVDTLNPGAIYQKATTGMVAELHDPYSAYLAPDRARRLNESTSGRYGGIGIQVDVREDGIVVVATMPGSPAERAGIAAGDHVVSVDGKPTAGWTFDEGVKALRGPRGSTVKLIVERSGVPERMTFTVPRDEIRVRSVRHAELVDNETGYVALTIFSDSSKAELQQAIDSLRSRGMRTLVLDLRNNPGGLLEQGLAVSDLFLDQGQRVVSMRGRAPGVTRDYTDPAKQPWPDLKLIVLVNESSASASEIVAGALQDHDRAVLIGNTTYGKGVAQAVYDFSDGGALRLTTARWYTPNGRSIQKTHGDADSVLADTTKRKSTDEEKRIRFRTDAGRTVLGGGGIIPDLFVARIDSVKGDGALARALGKDVPKFRDALSQFAVNERASHAVSSPDFTVTPEMREGLWQQMLARGIHIPRAAYDSASALIDRRIGDEVTRYAFGPDAALERQLRADRVLAAALSLARGATSERELLARAAARSTARREASAETK